MAEDPSRFLPAANGGRPALLKIHGIAAKPELNGKFGQAVSHDSGSGRYMVALLDAKVAANAAGGGANAGITYVKLKPGNLASAGQIDQLKFGAAMALESARAYASGPAAGAWAAELHGKLPPALRSRVEPRQALAGAAAAAGLLFVAASLVLGRLFGFSRLIMLGSIALLLAMISSPDWMEGRRAGKPLPLIAKGVAANFPRRWKEGLVNMTGYGGMSDRMSAAALVVFLLVSGKVLLTPSPRPRPAGGPSPTGGGVPRRPPLPPPNYDLEHIYKLGFDDAAAEREFGASLPEDIVEYNAAQEAALPNRPAGVEDGDGNFQWAYDPPPPPPASKPKLGIGTMFSMMMLYRFGKDTVTGPDGRVVLDPAYIMAQLRTMEKWRLGMMAITLYRVVSALSAFVR